MKHIKIGELEIPLEYFELNKEEKDFLINEVLNSMLILIDKTTSPAYNRIEILKRIIDSSIQTNVENEEYEICQVLVDLKKIINEERN